MPTISRRLVAALLGLIVLTTSVTVPAARADDGAQSAVVGAFGLGDGLEASIDERVGAVRVALPVAGLTVVWDSRAVDDDRYELGGGWSWNVTGLKTTGGLEVAPPSGGSFPPDDTHPSGLAGYAVEDVVFDQTAGSLPGRVLDAPDAIASRSSQPVEYAYVLHELGGVRTHFNAAGDPVARFDRFDARADWLWDETVPHRLVGVVDPDGVVTEVDWVSEAGSVLITAGANVPPGAGGGASWRVERDGGRVVSVTDAAGGRVSFDDDEGTGLVSSISAVSGGVTSIEWRTHADGQTRVAAIATRSASGAELSRREWRPGGDGAVATGWPAYAGEPAVFWSADPGFRYRTTLTDGATRVRSEYNSQHLLIRRSTVVTTPAGDLEVHDQALSYPGTEGGGVPDPAALPGNWSRPESVAVTYRDGLGGERTTTETFTFDAFGRTKTHVAHDGRMTTTEYDDSRAGRPLPVGLPTSETITGADGRVRITRHALDARRTAVVATQTLLGGESAAAVVATRAEFEVRADGLVLERREFPDGDAQQVPVVTKWNRTVDLARGAATATETIGAGTVVEATTTEATSLVHGGVISRTDPAGNTERADYDAIGRQVMIRDALGRRTETRFASAQHDGRNAVMTTGPDGVTVTEVRDELGRSIRTLDDIDDGAVSPGFERVSETRAYPEPGVVAVTDAWGATTTTRHDVFGRQVAVATPSGLVQLSLYDDVASTVTTALTPTGRLDDAELVRTETRDPRGQPVATGGRRADGRPVEELRAEYDGLGRRTRRIDTIAPDATGGRGGERGGERRGERVTTTEYAYDEHDRLIASSVSEGALPDASTAARARETSYTLSATGEVVSTTTLERAGSAGERTTTTAFEYGPLGQLLARTRSARGLEDRQTQTWDAAGNLLQAADGTRFEYDAANRPTVEHSADGSVTTLGYWPDGKRRERTTTRANGAASTTGFYWDGATLVNDTHTGPGSADSGVATYLLGTARQTRTATTHDGHAATTYYGTDRHGTVTEVTDDAGAPMHRLEYTDYGVPTREANSAPGLHADPFGYAGEYTDPSGRQLLGERTYDPDLMQLTTRDAAAQHNRYAYAGLNPITKSDPTGRQPAPDGWHQAVIGLGIVATVVIAVATAALLPAALSAFGVFTAVGGALADAYAIALGIGGLVVAARAGTSFSDEQAKNFFESDAAWISELTVGIGMAAAAYLLSRALPKLVSWYRARFPSPTAPRAGRAAEPDVFELNLMTDSRLDMSVDTSSKMERITDANELVAAWERLLDKIARRPDEVLSERFGRLLDQTSAFLGAKHPDAFATVCKVSFHAEGGRVTGFRAWLLVEKGVSLEFSAAVYEYAGLVRRPVAERIHPYVLEAYDVTVARDTTGDHRTVIRRVEERRSQLEAAGETINDILDRPTAIDIMLGDAW